MSAATQDALARLRRRANQPVETAEQRRARRRAQLARYVAKPPTSRAIDHLYEELRTLAEAPATPEGEARYREKLKRLSELEAEEARQLRQRLAATAPLKPGEVDAALREARELRARFENAAGPDPTAKRTDP